MQIKLTYFILTPHLNYFLIDVNKCHILSFFVLITDFF